MSSGAAGRSPGSGGDSKPKQTPLPGGASRELRAAQTPRAEGRRRTEHRWRRAEARRTRAALAGGCSRRLCSPALPRPLAGGPCDPRSRAHHQSRPLARVGALTVPGSGPGKRQRAPDDESQWRPASSPPAGPNACSGPRDRLRVYYCVFIHIK